MQPDTVNSTGKADATNIGIVLLAAGFSQRLGKPKQLLQYKGKSLLQHSIQAATTSIAQPAIVVLGARAAALKEEVKESTVQVVINDEWQEGMASSIRCGIKALTRSYPAVEGAILMVCDQPYVTATLLNELLTAHQKTGKPIVACSYANTFGPPVFFHHSLFPGLLQLKGDTGARGLIKQYANEVEVIPFPAGTVDIDTEQDYERLSEKDNE
jgi:molybdenum cofactor cytidylyltransferase